MRNLFSKKVVNDETVIYFLLCCGCFTISFNVAAIVAAVPAISTELRISDIFVSDIIPYYMIPYGLGALLYAPLTQHRSYKYISGVSLLFYALACFYCAVVSSLPQLLMGRFVMGVAGASAIPLGLIIIGQLFDKKVRGRLVGLFFSSSFLASIAGLILSGTVNWRWLFFVPALIGAVTAVCVLFLPLKPFEHVRGVKVKYWNAFKQYHVQRVFFFIVVISFLYHAVHPWFGVYLARSYHLNQLAISALLLIPLVSGALGQLTGGYLSDKKNRATACTIGLLILSCSTLLLYGRYPLAGVGFVFGLIAFGWTVGHNGMSTVLTDFPEEYRSEIASLNSSLRFIAGGIGFKVSKIFIEKGMSFEMNFLVMGLCMLVSGLFLKTLVLDE
ncbi:MAG: MFS transporter [Candidatus Omnitrophota bacterium]|jgi:predicted MFS family arabinose efflux permease